ncbi:hypothetical protein PYW07_016670 [Mythimna separata]|uniref:Partial AB-hydrolase lipase domain-containing protein n=1 Tax=Mythimna separata TaxID=271217 RepID=A0AAD7YM24_MYTSE|nr:hypothetical protein PYW07_016670 [Mythimna separata]
MKDPLSVVLLFIFVLQLNQSESRFQFSLFPNTLNITFGIGKQTRNENNSKFSKVFFETFNKMQQRDEKDDNQMKPLKRDNEDELQENDIPDNIVAEDIEEYMRPNEDPIILMSTMTTPQLLALHGYPAESHTIVTDDGYILTLHRIPYSKTSNSKISPKKTVLLHHGLFGSSAHWILAGPTKSLGYFLSDAGYDVWLANVRGNTYSRAHVSKNVDSREFWNFTFHEVSQHDLPAVIDYIMMVKGMDVKINYIGHSMGTTILFALLSTKTEYNRVLKAGFALAPVAYMTNIKSPLKKLAKHSNKIEYLLKILGGGKELLPQKPILKWLAKASRKLMNLDEEGVVEDTMSVLFGRNMHQFNKTLLPLILAQGAAGASTKTLVHYAQEIQQSGRFQMFDYGPMGNLKEYGTVSPPEYPLHKITLPIALFSAESDWLSSVVDVSRLQEQLVNPIEHYTVPLKEFSHADYLWGIDAPTLVYARLLQLLEEGVSKQNSNDDVLDTTKKETFVYRTPTEAPVNLGKVNKKVKFLKNIFKLFQS